MPDDDHIHLSVVTSPQEVTVAAVAAAAQPVAVAVETLAQPVEVVVSQGAPGAPGPPGANPEVVILTLAEYLALAPEVQMDGRWYLIPKT
jgi:hypothetical protein